MDKWKGLSGFFSSFILNAFILVWNDNDLVVVLLPIFPTGGIGRVMFEADLWTKITVEFRHLALPLIAYSIIFVVSSLCLKDGMLGL